MTGKPLSDTQSHPHKEGHSVILRADDVWFSYDGRTPVLTGVNAEFSEGMMTMMLGRSGSGKSTFLKILASLLKPTRGHVTFSGAGQTSSRSRGYAYIPQNLGLVRSMTALDNILIGALGETGTLRSLFKNFPPSVYDKAKKILSDLGILHLSRKKVWSLSGGERQRVAIARALIQNPRIILADEFVSQLDPVTSMEILSVMKDLTMNRIAFVITTHDVELVKKYADHLIILKHGKVSKEHCPVVMLAEEMMEEIR